jgi:hypothetical protein
MAATDLLARALNLSNILPQTSAGAESGQAAQPCQRMRWLSESEDDQLNASASRRTTTATRKVEPIRVKVISQRKTALLTSQPKTKRAKQPRPRNSELVPDAQRKPEAQEMATLLSPNTQRFAEACMRRLQLNEAMELSGKMYDDITACRGGNTVKHDCNFDVLRTLCMRKVMLDSLSQELVTRSTFPVTLNALSSMFSSVYLRFMR